MLTGARSPTGAGNVFRSAGLGPVPSALDNVRSGLKESAASGRDAAASTLDEVREREDAYLGEVSLTIKTQAAEIAGSRSRGRRPLPAMSSRRSPRKQASRADPRWRESDGR